jgi:hypothetical protein
MVSGHKSIISDTYTQIKNRRSASRDAEAGSIAGRAEAVYRLRNLVSPDQSLSRLADSHSASKKPSFISEQERGPYGGETALFPATARSAEHEGRAGGTPLGSERAERKKGDPDVARRWRGPPPVATRIG